MAFKTSKNLTIVGIAGIVAALASATISVFDGDPTTNVDLGLLAAAIYNGIVAIMAKGEQSTGGTVPTPTP